jgi:hypothetical protein
MNKDFKIIEDLLIGLCSEKFNVLPELDSIQGFRSVNGNGNISV